MNKSNKDLYVAASVGPYGATLHDMSEYDGHYVKTMTAQVLIVFDLFEELYNIVCSKSN